MLDQADAVDLGTCCICRTATGVRNVFLLAYKADIPGHGWGCLICGLAPDGTVAVLCDDCTVLYRGRKAQLEYVCRGYPPTEGLLPFAQISPERHEHDLAKHSQPDCENGKALF